MKKTISTILALAWAATSQGATITYVGSVEGPEATDWLTPSTAKTFDLDGDNVLGSTLGAVHWTRVGAGEVSAGSGTFGWSYQGETSFGQFSNAGYPMIDDLLDVGSAMPIDALAAIAAVQDPGAFNFGLEGTPANYDQATVRVGVMADMLTDAE